MPQLIFKACSAQMVQTLSAKLPPVLSQITDTPEDYFTFEWQTSHYFAQGQQTKLYPIVEIQQFCRPKSVQKQMAETIAATIAELGEPNCEIYFLPLGTEDYYEF